MSDFLRQFLSARRVSTPLVTVRTPDPAATMKTVLDALQNDAESKDHPILMWDVCGGLQGLNNPGIAASENVCEGAAPEKVTARPTEMLRLVPKLPEDAVVFMSNAHLFWKQQTGGAGDIVIQAIWNLRNPNKETGRMLVMLTTLGATLPLELANDVLVLDEPLPSVQNLEGIVRETYSNFGLDEPTAEQIDKATDALIGLAAFPAEAAAATSTTKANGMDYLQLWERKRQAIEQVKGLKVWRGGEKFADLGGLSSLKLYLTRVLQGKNRVRLVVFIDEIEKHFAGSGTDLSGVKTDMTGTFLTWMQDKRARGILLIGHPGTGKSASAKAMGNEAGIPTVALDFSGMQASLVGQSGENLRAALNVIDAMSEGGAFFVATCNKLESLPPELRRRFKRGTWFFDLPDAEERAALWAIYRKKYSIAPTDTEPPCEGWTGAEIEQCCEQADELQISLSEASGYVVPISKSASENIEALRVFANNRFLSVSYPGPYSKDGKPKTIGGSTRRIRS